MYISQNRVSDSLEILFVLVAFIHESMNLLWVFVNSVESLQLEFLFIVQFIYVFFVQYYGVYICVCIYISDLVFWWFEVQDLSKIWTMAKEAANGSAQVATKPPPTPSPLRSAKFFQVWYVKILTSLWFSWEFFFSPSCPVWSVISLYVIFMSCSGVSLWLNVESFKKAYLGFFKVRNSRILAHVGLNMT